ncbi:putative blue pigment (indigoidine) exporter [Hamadaea flava]|uniref:EamA family transporter n=1 Tax=Hamadaea flava TaxID=1742688 RepID=A0ABV8M068_9ACTN|nr:EamA family transporter [Hamadaea flava]MCP2326904.1 putative blue pigment (indigoidine) exporter [Hamadaea flava]
MRLLLTALAPLAWGSTYAVTTQLLPADRPLLAGMLRALPAGLLLLLLTRKLPSGRWWGKAFVLGVLNIGAFFPLLFLAAYRLPGGVAAVLGSVQPLIVIGLSAFLLNQRPLLRAVAAGAIGVLGVALVVLRPGASFDAVGLAAGLVGAAAMAAGTVLSKRWGRPDGVNALTTTAWQLTAGGLVIVPLALLIEGAPPALSLTNIAGYAYLATVNTAVAYWLWFRGLAALPASSAGFLGLLSPVAAMIIGWAALGQALAPVQVVGAVVALGATVAGALVAARPTPAPLPSPSLAAPR